LELLQARGRLTGPEIAERLEVDLRTVRRYVTMLQDLGIPVEGERGRAGGYRLRPGFKLPPLMLSNDEALAVTLGLMAARQIGLASSQPAVDGAIAKIERVLPPDLRPKIDAIHQTVAFDLPATSVAAGSATLTAIGEAALRRLRVWIRYGSNAGALTEREIDPYALVLLSGRWYIAGHCHLRNELRTFRADRILAIEPRQTPFVTPPDFDAMTYLRESLARTPGTHEVVVLLETSLERARRDISAATALLEPDPRGVIMRCWVDDLNWVARMLLGLSFRYRILSPAELRTVQIELARETIAHRMMEGTVA
jgi:predicted DNA-binding transcriptional regulator YafY